MVTQDTTDTILLMSRIDYGSSGFRTGLLELAAKAAEAEDIDFAVITGGLVSYYGLRDWINTRTKEAKEENRRLKREEKKKPKSERVKHPLLREVTKRTKERVLTEAAEKLAEAIPVMQNKDGKTVKIYITTSKAHNYDGPYGPIIAERLQRLRDDIVFWDRESARFPLKKSERVMWCLNPVKASWSGKYYSTSADKIVREIMQRTPQALPDLFVVGTGGSAINKPAGGENPVPMLTVPALHRIQKVNTSENQVGVCVVSISKDSEFPVTRTYNFKDFVAHEREFIPIPKGLEDEEGLTKYERDQRERQREILSEIVRTIPTIGMLEDALPWTRRTIEIDIKNYNERGFRPAIFFDEDSEKYNVGSEWLQFELRYPFTMPDKYEEDSMLTFCCLHAGSTNTQYAWFVQRVAELMLEHDIQNLVSCGDHIEGLKHNLVLRKEVYGGMNYTEQEELAAKVIGKPLATVFEERFDTSLSRKRKKPNAKRLRAMIRECLPNFRVWRGNHDEWTQDQGIEPLSTFRKDLVSYLTYAIIDHLASHNLALGNVRSLVEERVIYNKEQEFDSGVTMSIRHPHQGRMMTSSGRAQQTLWATKGQVVSMGNFHVSIAVHEWNPKAGQRLAFQLGTIKSGSDFEENINKLVDTGVGVAKVYSDPETHRIYVTEVIWDSPHEDEIENLDNGEIVTNLTDRIKV